MIGWRSSSPMYLYLRSTCSFCDVIMLPGLSSIVYSFDSCVKIRYENMFPSYLY